VKPTASPSLPRALVASTTGFPSAAPPISAATASTTPKGTAITTMWAHAAVSLTPPPLPIIRVSLPTRLAPASMALPTFPLPMIPILCFMKESYRFRVSRHNGFWMK